MGPDRGGTLTGWEPGLKYVIYIYGDFIFYLATTSFFIWGVKQKRSPRCGLDERSLNSTYNDVVCEVATDSGSQLG